jgi:hypothetical protein
MTQLSGSMTGLNGLSGRGRMTWSDPERGWLGVPGEILDALRNDGYDECKRETTSSHGDGRHAGGLWQGINAQSGSVAAAIWIARPPASDFLVFIQIDGESVARPGRAPDEEEGGES